MRGKDEVFVEIENEELWRNCKNCYFAFLGLLENFFWRRGEGCRGDSIGLRKNALNDAF